MCIIALTPTNVIRPSTDTLRNCFDYNDDGAGYAFAANGILSIRKPFFTFDSFLESATSDMKAYPTAPFLFHFRIATHGKLTPRNTHPHSLARGRIALAHNGVLPNEYHPRGAEVSDTVMLCKMLDSCAPDELIGKRLRKRLSHAIGKHNKLALLSATGRFSIVNSSEGHWESGTWFSNYSYRLQRIDSVCQRYSACSSIDVNTGDDTLWRLPDGTRSISLYDSDELVELLAEDYLSWNEVRDMVTKGDILPGTYLALRQKLIENYNTDVRQLDTDWDKRIG